MPTASDWELPESLPSTNDIPVADEDDMQPVQISWTPGSKKSATTAKSASKHKVEKAATNAAPSFYVEPLNVELPPPFEAQTYQFDMTTLSAGIPKLQDGRLAPALSKKTIIGLAIGGPLAVLLLVGLISFIGTSSASKSEDMTSSGMSSDMSKSMANEMGWVSFTDPAGHFTAMFPTQPMMEQHGATTIWSSAATHGSMGVVISTTTLPAGDYKNNKQALTDALNGTASGSGMTITGQVFDTNGSVLHLDALLTKDKTNANLRYFVSGGTLYGLLLTTNDESGDPHAFDMLTKSFQALDGKKPA